MSALALPGALFQWQPGWQLYAATSWPGSVPTHCPAWAGAARPSTDSEMPASAAAALVMARAFMDSPDFKARGDRASARDHATVPKAHRHGWPIGPRSSSSPQRTEPAGAPVQTGANRSAARSLGGTQRRFRTSPHAEPADGAPPHRRGAVLFLFPAGCRIGRPPSVERVTERHEVAPPP